MALIVEGKVESCRESEYQGRTDGYWLYVVDEAEREYAVKAVKPRAAGEEVTIPVRARAKKNGEGFWYAEIARPVGDEPVVAARANGQQR